MSLLEVLHNCLFLQQTFIEEVTDSRRLLIGIDFPKEIQKFISNPALKPSLDIT